MANKNSYKSLRGIPDILPQDAALMRWMYGKASSVFDIYGFHQIHSPILEETGVFTRSLGEHTDIVEKEMYSFIDRGGKHVSLRPEGTASIVRAYIEHDMYHTQGLVKLFYMGPMFRGERPQKGRLRQFHQIGAEIIGFSNSYTDAELISSIFTILKEIKVEGFTILVNSLGCSDDRKNYSKALTDYLEEKKEKLCDDCKRRIKINVLRVLDCKKELCKDAIKSSPSVLEYLCEKCHGEYNALKKIIRDMGIPFQEKKDLVRGLDYYTGMVFEVVHPLLGAQDAIAAGGRYDNLTQEMGGPDVGAAGYAIGVERTFLVMDRDKILPSASIPLIIPVDGASMHEAFKIAAKLRGTNIPCEVDYSDRSLKGKLRKAEKDGRTFTVIIGEDEIKAGKFILKDMKKSEQRLLSFEEIAKELTL